MGTRLSPGFQAARPSGNSANLIHVPALGDDGAATGTLLRATQTATASPTASCFVFPAQVTTASLGTRGVRIIDNNSAINVNTALSRDNEYTVGAGGLTVATQIIIRSFKAASAWRNSSTRTTTRPILPYSMRIVREMHRLMPRKPMQPRSDGPDSAGCTQRFPVPDRW